MFVHRSLFYTILLKNAISKANEWNVNREREIKLKWISVSEKNFSIAFVFLRLYVCKCFDIWLVLTQLPWPRSDLNISLEFYSTWGTICRHQNFHSLSDCWILRAERIVQALFIGVALHHCRKSHLVIY